MNEIVLLVSPSKVMRFSLDGKFKSERPLTFHPLKFQASKDGYVFWNAGNSSGHPAITCTDKDFNIINEYFNFDEKLVSSKNMLTTFDGNIYLRPFNNQYWNHVFEIKVDTFLTKYLIDFGSHNWPQEDNLNLKNSSRRGKGYFGFVDRFFETNNWITFNFASKGVSHNAIYNKTNGESFWWKGNFKYNLPAALFEFLISQDEKNYYSSIEPMILKSCFKYYAESNKHLGWPDKSMPFEQIEKLVSNYNVEDNPIIFTFSLK